MVADINVPLVYDEVWVLDNPLDVIIHLAVNLFDSVIAGEDIVMFVDELDVNINIFDGVAVGEDNEMAQEHYPDIYDGITVVENNEMAQESRVEVNDTPTVLDVISTDPAIELTPDVNDAVVVGEDIAGFPHALFRSVTDVVVVTESVTVSDIATTTAYSKNVVHLTSIDSNWWWTDIFPGNVNGILLVTIQFYAAGADTLVFRDGAMDGPIMAKIVTAAAGNFTVNIGRTRVRPCLNIADCSLTDTSSVSLIYDH